MNGPPEKSGANYPQYQRKAESETHCRDMSVLRITRGGQPAVKEAIGTSSKAVDLPPYIAGVYTQSEEGL